jgi:hypothetical protein
MVAAREQDCLPFEYGIDHTIEQPNQQDLQQL